MTRIQRTPEELKLARKTTQKKARAKYAARRKAEDPKAWAAINAGYTRKRRDKHPKKMMLYRARNNARIKGMACDITEDDIIIPDMCPVLGIPLIHNAGTRRRSPNAPSIDRIDCSKGYTKDNVRVISWRANDLIANGTLEEFKKVVTFLEANQI